MLKPPVPKIVEEPAVLDRRSEAITPGVPVVTAEMARKLEAPVWAGNCTHSTDAGSDRT